MSRRTKLEISLFIQLKVSSEQPRVQHVAFHKVSTEARLTNNRQCYIQMLVSYTSLFLPSTGSGEQAELPVSPSKLWMAR